MGGLSIKPSSIGALFSKNPFECLLGNDSSSVIRSIRHFWKMPSQNICEYWCQNWRTRPTKDILGCQMRTILGNSGYYSELQYVQILVCRTVLWLMYWCTDVLYTSSSCCYLETSWNTKWNHIVILESSFWWHWAYRGYHLQLKFLIFGHCAYIQNIFFFYLLRIEGKSLWPLLAADSRSV